MDNKNMNKTLNENIMADPSTKLINLYNIVKDNPELTQLIESASDLKKNDILYLVEMAEYIKSKDIVELGEKGKIVYKRFKRISVDWIKLSKAIELKGYTLSSLSSKIGLTPSTLSKSKSEGVINPFLLEEICIFLHLKFEDYCTEHDYIRVRNGRSISKKIPINWKLLNDDIKNNGYSLSALAKKLGKHNKYFSNCKQTGNIPEKELKRIGRILKRNYKEYYFDDSQVKKNLIDSVNDIYK